MGCHGYSHYLPAREEPARAAPTGPPNPGPARAHARASRPLPAEAHAHAPWGERERPHSRPPPPARAAVSGARCRAGLSARCQQSLARPAPLPPPPAPPPPPPPPLAQGGARTWGPQLVSAPGQPAAARREPAAGPAWLRAAPFRLEPRPSAPFSDPIPCPWPQRPREAGLQNSGALPSTVVAAAVIYGCLLAQGGHLFVHSVGSPNLPVKWRKALCILCHLCTGGN